MKMSPGPYYKKGSQLVATGKVRPMGDGQYTVQSESGENEYSVDQNGCSCPTAQFRPYVMCKHHWAVIIFRSRNPEDCDITAGESSSSNDLPDTEDPCKMAIQSEEPSNMDRDLEAGVARRP